VICVAANFKDVVITALFYPPNKNKSWQ